MKSNQNKSVDPMEDDYLKTSSAQDCTGLIPAGMKDPSEMEHYEELYPFLPKAIPSNPGEDTSK